MQELKIFLEGNNLVSIQLWLLDIRTYLNALDRIPPLPPLPVESHTDVKRVIQKVQCPGPRNLGGFNVSARRLTVLSLKTWQHYFPAMQMFVFISKRQLFGGFD